jgi:hypothetical protein
MEDSTGARFPEARIFCAGPEDDFRETFDIFKPELVLLEYPASLHGGLDTLEFMRVNAPEIPFICLADSPDEELEAVCMSSIKASSGG